MKQPTKQLTPARLIALQIRNDAFRAAIERHPHLKDALLGKLAAPDSAQDADVTWRPRHGEGDDPHA